MEKDLSEIWSLVLFHVSLWVSISKTFCNYSTRYNFLELESLLVGWDFLYVHIFFHFFSMEAVVSMCVYINYGSLMI